MSRRRSAAWIVVALGAVALAVLIGQRHVAPRSEITQEAATRPVSKPSPERENDIAVPSGVRTAEDPPRLPVEKRLAIPATSKQLPTSEIADAKAEELRQSYWQRLRAFAVEADLTEREWEKLLGDISDLAESEIDAHLTASEEHASSEDAFRLTDDLARELDERCASWMTERQLKIYDFRLDSTVLLSMTRQLRTLGSLWKVPAARLSDARP